MVAMRMRGRRGLTLIEILIALIILMVGLVGIFALFPVGIRSTQESVEDSTAALVAESFHHALIAAMRSSPPAGGPNVRVDVVMCHDGLPGRRHDGGTTHNATAGGSAGGALLPDNTYVFFLPSESDGPTASTNLATFPRRSTGSPTAPQQSLFRMAECGQAGTPQYVKRCLMGTGNNRTTPSPGSVWSEDASEALDQYFVAFDVVRVRDQNNLYTQPLFEFRIGVYRNYQDRGAQGWAINDNPPGGAAWPAGSVNNPNGHPDLKKVFRTLIAGN